MPKTKDQLSINIDLLKPQDNQERLLVKITHWLLSTGRYIIIAVEFIVLAAFISRFKLDADLSTNKEAIEEQIPFIKSQKSDELLIRQTQLQLATIRNIRQSSPDFTLVLQKIAAQTPQNVTITTINLEAATGNFNLKITGQSLSNNGLSVFVSSLKKEKAFSDINLANVGLDQEIVNFSITGFVNQQKLGEL